MSKRNVLIKQHDSTDCAAACLSMVCFYYKKELNIAGIRDILGTDIKGTTLLGLEQASRKLGFESKAVRVSKSGFKSKFTLPAIAHTVTDQGWCHFVVIRKIKNDKVWVSDPVKGNLKMSIDEFYKDFDGVVLLLVPSNEFIESKQKTKSVFQRYINLIKTQKRLFAYAIISSFILTMLGIFSSMFNKYLMDEILPYKLKKDLIIYAIIFALVGMTQIAIEFVRSHMLLYLSQKIDIPLVLGYFKHIFSLPMKFFSTRKVGDILTRFSDSFTIKNVLTSVYLTTIIDIIMAVASAVILLTMSKPLFVVILIIALVSALIIYIFKKPYKNLNLEKMEQASELNSSIIENLKGIETIKANAYENKTMDNIERNYIKSLRVSFREGFLSNIQALCNSVTGTFGNLTLMCVGANLVMNGDMTLGTLLAFASLSTFFMVPIGRLIGIQLSLQEANISMKRMSEILEIEPERYSEGFDLEDLDGDICLNNVTFRYGYRSPVINNVSFTIPKGKKVALVGESGSGKTTISKLLLRFFETEDGEITIGGKNICDMNVEQIRKSIGYVPQNIELFSGTIKDNIRVGKEDATDMEIQTVCKLTGCDEFINRMPAKYDSFLEEAGGGLSGGERQRLAMARAMIKSNKFLILDEATSNLDFLSERKIYDTIFNKLKGTTMLIIAHRLSTIRNCDVICVLDKGKVSEIGTHEELIAMNGMYYKLWASQVGLDIPEDEKEEEKLNLETSQNVMVY